VGDVSVTGAPTVSPTRNPQSLFTLPFETILRRTSERTAYPGGGAASAMACASAASLVAMVARYTGEAAAVAVTDAESAIEELHHLADEDEVGFADLMEAWAEPKDAPGRAERVASAASRASEVPLRICRVGAEVARHAASLAVAGKRDLRGDAFAAAYLCLAGVLGSARLFELNAGQASDLAPVEEVRAHVASTRDLVRRLDEAQS
jgi:methenyltetrahydrofolate cyclohydrolase